MTHTVDRLFTTPPLPGIKCDWTNIKKPSNLLTTHYSLLTMSFQSVGTLTDNLT